MIFYNPHILLSFPLQSEIVRKTYANVDMSYHQRKMHEIYDMCEIHLKKHKYIATDYVSKLKFKYNSYLQLKYVHIMQTKTHK